MTREQDETVADAVRLVTQRLDFLERLSVSPRSKRRLVDELPYSRSTVDRAVRDLQIAGLIERTADGYVTTLAGRVSAEQYRHFNRTAHDTLAVRDIVGDLPADAPVDGRTFRGSTARRTDDIAPYEVVDHLVESLDGADRLRTLSEGLPHPQYLDAVVERVERGSLTVDSVVSPSLWQAFVEHHPDDVETILDVGMDVRIGDVPPFTLHLIDGDGESTVQLLVHSDTGGIRGVVINETTAAVEWATALFERVSSDAELPPDVGED